MHGLITSSVLLITIASCGDPCESANRSATVGSTLLCDETGRADLAWVGRELELMDEALESIGAMDVPSLRATTVLLVDDLGTKNLPDGTLFHYQGSYSSDLISIEQSLEPERFRVVLFHEFLEHRLPVLVLGRNGNHGDWWLWYLYQVLAAAEEIK